MVCVPKQSVLIGEFSMLIKVPEVGGTLLGTRPPHGKQIFCRCDSVRGPLRNSRPRMWIHLAGESSDGQTGVWTCLVEKFRPDGEIPPNEPESETHSEEVRQPKFHQF